MANKSSAPPPPPQVTGRHKYYFSAEELGKMFKITRKSVLKRIETAPMLSDPSRRGTLYDINDVSTLMDCRIDAKPVVTKATAPTAPIIGDDPATIGMNPSQIKMYYQAKDVEQAYLIKRKRVEVDEGIWIHEQDVERGIANSYKGVATFLGNLTDILERSGIIDTHDVPRVSEMISKTQLELADSMGKIARNMSSEKLDDMIDD